LREALPSEVMVTIGHSNCFITTLQIVVIHSRIVAHLVIWKAKTNQKVPWSSV